MRIEIVTLCDGVVNVDVPKDTTIGQLLRTEAIADPNDLSLAFFHREGREGTHELCRDMGKTLRDGDGILVQRVPGKQAAIPEVTLDLEARVICLKLEGIEKKVDLSQGTMCRARDAVQELIREVQDANRRIPVNQAIVDKNGNRVVVAVFYNAAYRQYQATVIRLDRVCSYCIGDYKLGNAPSTLVAKEVNQILGEDL